MPEITCMNQPQMQRQSKVEIDSMVGYILVNFLPPSDCITFTLPTHVVHGWFGWDECEERYGSTTNQSFAEHIRVYRL